MKICVVSGVWVCVWMFVDVCGGRFMSCGKKEDMFSW